MRHLITILYGWLLCILPTHALALDIPLSPEDKTALRQAQTISLETIALTEKGPTDPGTIREAVANRLQKLGYHVTNGMKDSGDVILKVKCEERKTWARPSRYGSPGRASTRSSRVWKGPACQLTYRLNGHQPSWQYEVRTPFEDANQAAQASQEADSGRFAMAELAQQLQRDDFPLILSAEWGQMPRLIALFNQPETNVSLRLKILPLLGKGSDPSILPLLREALAKPDLAMAAVRALGDQGEPAIELLISLLHASPSTDLQVAAANSLGHIAAKNSKAAVFTPLVTVLKQPETPIPVQTSIVRALGLAGDQRALPILETLNHQAWTDPSSSPDMQQLREALSWSLWQLNPDAHTSE